MSVRIREVVVEILRHGEPHNQLLSPLTRYLVLCGSHPAEQLTIPFEHRELEFRLSRMHYSGGVASDVSGDRRFALEQLAATVTDLFEQIPALPHVGRVGAGELLHLRLMITPQELALMPFELANPPSGFGSVGHPLLLGPDPDVVLTREVRRTGNVLVRVPAKPRILLAVASPSGRPLPYEQTRTAIVDALLPWARSTVRDGRIVADLDAQLVILERASLDEIRTRCATGRFTHVHLLAHGAEVGRPGQEGFGIVLWDRQKESEEVVDGPALARALRPPQDDSSWAHPWCVVLCTCESGDIGGVLHPSASLAHALHVAGIPLVLASQFPLTFGAATTLTKTFYPLELRGEDPRRTIRDVRHAIASRMRETHDWASLVAYAGLPDDVGSQLESIRVVRTFAQLEAAQDWADRLVKRTTRAEGANAADQPGSQVDAEVLERSIQLIEAAAEKLRREAVFNESRRSEIKRRDELNEITKHEKEHLIASVTALLTEIYGLLGSAAKRRARLLAVLGSERKSREALRESADWYLRGARLLAPEHWTACQSFVMLGIGLERGWASDDDRKQSHEQWKAALDTATKAVEDPGTAIWAYGTLIEVEIWRPFFEKEANSDDAQRSAIAHFAKLRSAVGGRTFPLLSTERQLIRYRDWWGRQGYLDQGVLARATAVLENISGQDSDFDDDDALVIELPQSADSVELGDSIELGESDEVLGSGHVTPVAVVEVPTDTFYRIDMLPARQGDALWVEYGTGDDVHRLLIDGGFRTTIRTVDQRIHDVAGSSTEGRCHFDLGVVSHIDADHIEGFIEILASQRPITFGDLWFNGRRHLNVTPVESLDDHAVLGGKHGLFLDQLIELRGPKWNRAFEGGEVVVPPGSGPLPVHELPGGMKLTLMSPTNTELHDLASKWDREVTRAGLDGVSLADVRRAMDRLHYSTDAFDDSGLLRREKPSGPLDIDALLREPDGVDGTEANGSSIAFVAEFGGRSCLFAADAHPDVLIDSIDRLVGAGERLSVGAVKLPHHGSGNNVTLELLRRIDSHVFLISTNGGGHFHPDRHAIAKLVAGDWRPNGDDPIHLLFNYRSSYTEVWDDEDLMDAYGYTVAYAEPGDILQLAAVPLTPGR